MDSNFQLSDIFVPDGVVLASAVRRTTHLGIMAHPDDLEFWAYHGIAECYHKENRWFGGLVVTDGAGAPRGGALANCTADEIKRIRRQEQQEAACLGQYSFVAQLGYSSTEVKRADSSVAERILAIVEQCSAETVYLHNPIDKHPTHVAVFLRSIEALRRLPEGRRPARVLGCEGWRGLDWLSDDEKIGLDTSAFPELKASLQRVFVSQIAQAKRYDVAVTARQLANATLYDSHSVDQSTSIAWAMDLTPLVSNPTLSVAEFVAEHIERLRSEAIAVVEGIAPAMP